MRQVRSESWEIFNKKQLKEKIKMNAFACVFLGLLAVASAAPKVSDECIHDIPALNMTCPDEGLLIFTDPEHCSR